LLSVAFDADAPLAADALDVEGDVEVDVDELAVALDLPAACESLLPPPPPHPASTALPADASIMARKVRRFGASSEAAGWDSRYREAWLGTGMAAKGGVDAHVYGHAGTGLNRLLYVRFKTLDAKLAFLPVCPDPFAYSWRCFCKTRSIPTCTFTSRSISPQPRYERLVP
jgi:hypothetical protein